MRPKPAENNKSKDVEADIKRIDEIIRNARTTWFALLASLVFAGITLASVRDVAFFATDQRTQLPLVNISVPITSFFTAGSALIAAFYIYFHVYLERLWQALAEAYPRVGRKPLADKLHFWVVADSALRIRDWLRDDTGVKRASAPRSMAAIGNLAAVVLVWIFGLFIVAWFWWRSMPAHNPAMTGTIAVVLIVTLGVSLRSSTAAHAYLAKRTAGRRWWAVFFPAVLAIGGLTVVRTWIDPWEGKTRETVFSPFQCIEDSAKKSPKTRFCWTGFEFRFDVLRPAPADLREVVFTEKPRDWLGLEITETEFRVRWCQQKLRLECGNLLADEGALKKEEEDAFQKEWAKRQTALLAAMPKPDLRNKDLRGADLVSAKLEGADLSGAKLQGANLSRAELQGANLFSAKLHGANLSVAELNGAYLFRAELQGANLSGAALQGANLFSAKLQGANLSWAILEGANLSWATLKGATFFATRLEGKPDQPIHLSRIIASQLRYSALRNANLANSRLADLRQFETNFGDGTVLLPPGYPRPCHWATKRLDDAAFFGRWRGWLAKNRVLVADLEDYPAVPPSGCNAGVSTAPATIPPPPPE